MCLDAGQIQATLGRTTHGRRGLKRLLLGSDAEYIAQHTSVPVLLYRFAPRKSFFISPSGRALSTSSLLTQPRRACRTAPSTWAS